MATVEQARAELARRELARRSAQPREYDPLANDERSLPPLPGESVRRAAQAPAAPKPGYATRVMDAFTQPTVAPGRGQGGANELIADIGDIPLVGPAYGLAENAAMLATGAVAPALAGIRGVITGDEPTNADIADLTYSPRTQPGRVYANALGEVTSPVTDFAEELGLDQALLPLAGEMNALGAPRKGGKQVAPTSTERASAKAEAPTKKARSLGAKLSPSEESRVSGNKNYFGRTLETLAGKGDVQRDMSEASKGAFTKRAEKAIGAEDLTETGIKKVKDAGSALYTEMGKIGKIIPDETLSAALEKARGLAGSSTKRNQHIDKLVDDVLAETRDVVDADQVVNRVRELRAQAHLDMGKQLGQANDVQVQARGKASLKLADALDDWLERSATAGGNADLGKRYKAARAQLAKANTVADASRAGKVSAQELYSAKKGGAPLTGELEEIADANEYFPESTNDAKTPDYNTKRPSNLLELPVTAAQSFIRPAISKFLQSDLYQNRFGKVGSQDFADNADAFDQWPGTQTGDPSVGPVQGVNPPRIDFEGELGIVPDSGPRASLPGGNLRGAQSDLELAEDVPPQLPGRRGAPSDALDFEAVTPDQVGPMGFRNTEPVQDFRPRAGAQRGAAVSMSDGLELAPEHYDGPVDALPEGGGRPSDLQLAPEFEGGIPFTREPPQVSSELEFAPETGHPQFPQMSIADELAGDLGLEPPPAPPRKPLALPAPGQVPIKLRDQRTVDAELLNALGLTGDVRDAGPRHPGSPDFGMEPMGMQQQMQADPLAAFADRYLVPGTTRYSAVPDAGYIGYATPQPGVRQINDAFVKPEARGQGAGQRNLVGLAEEAAAAGDVLNSDVSLTAAQARVYQALADKGLLDFDVSDPAAFAEALQLGSIVKGGESPVVRNIRPKRK